MRPLALAFCCGLALAAGAVAQPTDAQRKLAEGRALYDDNCQPDGFDAAGCSRAAALLREAAAADPTLVDAQLWLGKALWNSGFAFPKQDARRAQLKTEGQAVLRRLVDRKVADARPYYELSVITDDQSQRQQLLERTVQLNPRHPQAHRDLADLDLAQGRPDDAKREYLIHMDVSPGKDLQDGLDHVRFAGQLSAAGAQKQAGEIYGKLVETTRNEPRSRRCTLFRKVPVRSYATTAWARSVTALEPFCADQESLDSAAKLERQGDSEGAMRTLEGRLRANPRNDEMALRLRQLKLSRGDRAAAAQTTNQLFRAETDPRERCRIYRALSADAKADLDASTRQALERDCPAKPE